MPISMSCPSCGKNLSAPDSSTGKKAKCPSCGQIMIVPALPAQPDPGGYDFQPQQPSFSPEPAPQSAASWLDEMQGPAASAAPGAAGSDARRPCPECGEMIPVAAAKCRFCEAIFDPRLKARAKGKQSGSGDDENLSTGEWLICIFCAGIGCIVGVVYAVQGKPKGMKMVGISIAAAVVWNVLSFAIQVASR